MPLPDATPTSDSSRSAPAKNAAPGVLASKPRGPLLGALSWLVAPGVLAAASAAAQASPEISRMLVGNAGVAVGVLACSVLGLLLAMGSRVRGERWPWVGIVGAMISTLPLALFLAGMLFRL